MDSSIWPITSTTTLSQSGPGSNGNEEVLHFTPSDGLMSYLGHSLRGGSYFSVEMQSEYPTALADLVSSGFEFRAFLSRLVALFRLESPVHSTIIEYFPLSIYVFSSTCPQNWHLISYEMM